MGRKGSGRVVLETMRDEYDFGGGVRGKYAGRVPKDAIMVVLEPDVAAKFPTAEEVNKALRGLMRSAAKAPRTPRK